jgi:hypothetical protein
MIDISKNKCVVAIITVERDMVAPLRVDQVADLKDVRILPPELSERVSVGVQKSGPTEFRDRIGSSGRAVG